MFALRAAQTRPTFADDSGVPSEALVGIMAAGICYAMVCRIRIKGSIEDTLPAIEEVVEQVNRRRGFGPPQQQVFVSPKTKEAWQRMGDDIGNHLHFEEISDLIRLLASPAGKSLAPRAALEMEVYQWPLRIVANWMTKEASLLLPSNNVQEVNEFCEQMLKVHWDYWERTD
jgi:hypothetical protein